MGAVKLRRDADRKRAAFAWGQVEKAASEKFADAYRDLARKFPALVLGNGLGQALAFLLARGTRKPKKDEPVVLDTAGAPGFLYAGIQRWLCEEEGAPYHSGGGAGQAGGGGRDQFVLVHRILDGEGGSPRYRQATLECLSLLTWLKRFAEAVIVAEGAVTGAEGEDSG